MHALSYSIAAVIAFAAAAAATPLVRRLATRLGAVDEPGGRKRHAGSIPLMGGLAVYAGVMAGMLYAWRELDLASGYIHESHIVMIALAGAALMIGGYLDDRYALRPLAQLIAPAVAIALALAADVGVRSISNPFAGGYVSFGVDELPVYTQPLMVAVTAVWLLGMMYTTKILDGLDGLVTGLGAIGSVVIAAVALRPELQQSSVALLAVIFAAACAGFLIYNFNPARIFLGEGGSTFIGFMLGILSIIAGTKIATALLIIGMPALDLAWVLYCRARSGQSIAQGDRRHLHFRMLDAGFSQRQVVMLLYLLTASFGAAAALLQTSQKLYALAALAAVTVATAAWIYRKIKSHGTVC